ncbi:aspartyl protease_2 domain-containing protein [Tanacetum coccineum]
MGGRSYSPSPPPRGGHGRRGRSPSPRGRYGRGGGGGGGRGRDRDLPTSLLVRNLRRDCRPEDLRRPFGQFGPLKDIYLPRDYYSGCENVISATMVSKLRMTEEHPPSLQIVMVQKVMKLEGVSQRMSCHMLPIVEPWHISTRKTMHDGYKNTYSFKKNGETIILGPSNIRKESKNQLLSQVEFLAEAQDATNVYALVVVESNECRFDVPHEVKAILDDFADVVPDELPPDLPPMRDIQHCIDFVPGAVIPHKAAYRMNPKEHEELQRQVRELLSCWKRVPFEKA